MMVENKNIKGLFHDRVLGKTRVKMWEFLSQACSQG